MFRTQPSTQFVGLNEEACKSGCLLGIQVASDITHGIMGFF